MSGRPESILFLARSLDRGGAERQLVELAKGLAGTSRTVSAALFFGQGALALELPRAGVQLIDLRKRGRWDLLSFLLRLIRVARQQRPAVLHSYMTVPNILAVLLKPLLPGTRVVWGVRASKLDMSSYDWLVRASHSAERRLSRWADLIIANSQAGRRDAIAAGFRADRMVVVPNGIDTERFAFSLHGRQTLRREWGLQDSHLLIGVAARLDAMKDHATFLNSAVRVARHIPQARFVIVGDGLESYAQALRDRPAARDLLDRLLWAGERDDMTSVYSALDIAVSSSRFGEGFSNSVAEAMACARPCVVTDVGDSRTIVGETGAVVPVADEAALADALTRMAGLTPAMREALGAAARQRVCEHYSREALLSRTIEALNAD